MVLEESALGKTRWKRGRLGSNSRQTRTVPEILILIYLQHGSLCHEDGRGCWSYWNTQYHHGHNDFTDQCQGNFRRREGENNLNDFLSQVEMFTVQATNTSFCLPLVICLLAGFPSGWEWTTTVFAQGESFSEYLSNMLLLFSYMADPSSAQHQLYVCNGWTSVGDLQRMDYTRNLLQNVNPSRLHRGLVSTRGLKTIGWKPKRLNKGFNR